MLWGILIGIPLGWLLSGLLALGLVWLFGGRAGQRAPTLFERAALAADLREALGEDASHRVRERQRF